MSWNSGWCNTCFCNPCTCGCSSGFANFGSCAPCNQTSCPQFATSFSITNSWNIPACAGSAVLAIPGLQSVVIGTFLFIPTYGYFQITGFNSINGQVTVINNCYTENATPGTMVPANSQVILSAIPGSSAGLTSSWTPTLTASGAMTVSAQSTKEAVYFSTGNHVFFRFGATFTLGGTQDLNVYIPLPTAAIAYGAGTNYICTASQNGSPVTNEGIWTIDATPRIIVGTAAGANWTLGANAKIMIQGWYDKS